MARSRDNNSSEQPNYDAIDLTFQCGREHLWYLNMDDFIVKDIHTFKAMTRAVLEFVGYKFNGGDYLHGKYVFESTTEKWAKDSKSYTLNFMEVDEATCMLTFWNTDDHNMKSQKFFISEFSKGKCPVREKEMRDRLLAFFQSDRWWPSRFSDVQTMVPQEAGPSDAVENDFFLDGLALRTCFNSRVNNNYF